MYAAWGTIVTGAATLPAHRRHGIQSVLFLTRLSDAAAAGCDIGVITTHPHRSPTRTLNAAAPTSTTPERSSPVTPTPVRISAGRRQERARQAASAA